MVDKKPDPTKDAEFQKVVQTFLHRKPQPHKLSGKTEDQENGSPT
jgi:hypothetical protein